MAFNDPRLAVPEPQVSSPPRPRDRSGDTSTAEAIQGFGQLAGDVRRGVISSDLQRDLEGLVDTAAVVDQQAIARETTGIEPSLLDVTGADSVIDGTSKQFKRLKLLRDQGKLTEAGIAIEGESILKAAINRAPAFATEFRQLARDVLTFDPSNAFVQSALKAITERDKARALTEREKLENAARLAAEQIPGLDFETAFNRLVTADFLQETKPIVDDQIRKAELSVPKIIADATQRLDLEHQGLWAQAALQIGQGGGISDIESLTTQADQFAQEQRSRLQELMANSPELYSQERINEAIRAIDTKSTNFKTTLASNDIADVLQRDQEAVFNAIRLFGARAGHEILAINEVGGQVAVQEYFTFTRLADDNPKKQEAFRRLFPGFDKSSQIAESSDKLASTLNFILGDKTPTVPNSKNISTPDPASDESKDLDLSKEEDRSLLDAATEFMSRFSPNVENKVAAVGARMRVFDRPVQSVNMMAQIPGSFDAADEETKGNINTRVTDIQNATISQVINGLAGTPTLLAIEDGQFVLVDRELQPIEPLSGGEFSLTRDTVRQRNRRLALRRQTDSARQAVNTMNNSVIRLFDNDPKWLQGAAGNVQSYMQEMLDQVNSRLVVTEAVINPDLSASASNGPIISPELQDRIANASSMDALFDAAEEAGLGDFTALREQQRSELISPRFFTDQDGNVFRLDDDGNLVAQ